MLFNGKSSLILFLLCFFSLNLLSVEVTEYFFSFEIEDNTGDIVTTINYNKDFSLDDVYSSIDYYERFNLKENSFFYTFDFDFSNKKDYFFVFANDENNIKKTLKNDKNNRFNSIKKINGIIQSDLYYNHYFNSINKLNLFNKEFYENLIVQSDKENIYIQNEFKYDSNRNFGISNYSDFNYGKSKTVFSNLNFYQRIQNNRLDEFFLFEYDIAKQSFLGGANFSFSINNYKNGFEFYFDDFNYIFGYNFGLDFDFINYNISHYFETDFIDKYKIDFDFNLNFTYNDAVSFTISKINSSLEKKSFIEAIQKIDYYYEKNIYDIGLLNLKLKYRTFLFELNSFFYSSDNLFVLNLNKLPIFNIPDIFLKITFLFEFKRFIFDFSPYLDLINFTNYNTGLNISFNQFKINIVELSFGYNFLLKNNINILENRTNLRIDFNITNLGKLFIKGDVGIGINDLMNTKSINLLYFVEFGFRSYF
ncbi:MAG TPA: hypothetical protein PK771_02285 [Spirochaetota bacterium]|nr:hypothetical protein [Spirochaetota bacterium]